MELKKKSLCIVLALLMVVSGMMLSIMTIGLFRIPAHAAGNTTEYTITYHLDGGTNALKNPDVYTSEDVITLKDASKTGYDFAGWFLDPEMTEQISVISNRTGNLDLYAKFTPKTYTATFDDNGATSSSELTLTFDDSIGTTKTVRVNNGDEILPYSYWVPTRSGYAFAGWYFGTELISSSYNMTTDMTLTAKWVKCVQNGETVREIPIILGEPIQNDGGNSISTLYEITIESIHYVTGKSIIENVNTGEKTISSQSLKHDNKKNEYYYDGVDYYDCFRTDLYVYSGQYATVNYEFDLREVSWSKYDEYNTDEQSVAVLIIDVETEEIIVSYRQANTLDPYYRETYYEGSFIVKPGQLLDIRIFSDGIGTSPPTGWSFTMTMGDPNPCKVFPNGKRTIEQEMDSYINAPSVSKKGYNFLGWYDASGNKMAETWQYTEDQTFTANWQPIKYNITYNLDGGRNSPSNPASYTIEDSITLNNPSKAGYTFKGWYSDSSFNTKITTITNQTGNVTLYAKWESNRYKLILDADGGVIAPKVTFVSDGVEINNSYVYPQNTITAYRPASKDGYIFAGWYKDASFTELFVFNGTITEDVTLYAKWIECSDTVINIENVDSLVIDVAGRTEQLYAFVPLVDGTIVVTSSSDGLDLYGILYDASKNELITADDISDTDLDFSYTYNVKAGQLYYIAVKGATTSTKGEATIDVRWTGNCTITGTTYPNKQITVVYDTHFKLPEKPIRNGFVFLGWFDETDTQITDGIWNFTTDKTLTAKWVEETLYTAILELREDLAPLKGKCLEIEGEIAKLNTLISEHSSRCENSTCTIEQVIYNLECTCARFAEFKYQINTLDAKICELENTGEIDVQKINKLKADIEELDNRYVGGVIIDADLAALHTDIDNLNKQCTTSVVISSDVTSIGGWEFAGYSALTSVTIPDSVISIGYCAFEDCESLTSIIFEGTVQQWQAITKGNGWDRNTGEYTIYCTDGEVSKDGTSKCYEHSLGDWYETTEPTCISDGLERRDCTKCDYYETNILEKLGHDMSSATCTEASKCKRTGCNYTEGIALGHAWSDATCITPKTCANCGKTDGGLADHTRDFTHKCTTCGHIGGKCGDNLTWEFDAETGKLTISGEGNMTDSPWDYYRNDIVSVMIEDGATSIVELAFNSYERLVSVTIGNGVTSIGDHAFSSCYRLREITIPASVISIGDHAFDCCFGLSSVTIPSSVTSIGNYAFYNCDNLKEITIPAGVNSIGNHTFYHCTGLTEISIPASVTSIGSYALNGCSSLTTITIPSSVTSIGQGAFYDCSSLTSITFEGNAPIFGNEVFCKVNATAYYPAGNDSWTVDVMQNYGGTITWMSYAKPSEGLEYTLSDDGTYYIVSGIGTCTDTNVVIPSTYNDLPVREIGEDAFKNCDSLTNVNIPDSVTSIGARAFSECDSLTSVTIPKGVTSIGNSAFFSCSSLTSITIQKGVTSIGNSAFFSCSSLTSITIPSSVISIGGSAFSLCSGLTSITIPDSITSIGECVFFGCSSLTSITIPEGVTSIGNSAFTSCSSLTSITIPDSVTSIGSSAFSVCSSLTSITIPEGVTSIGNDAFYDCNGLTSVILPNSVTSIGDYAFYGCASLTSITFEGDAPIFGNEVFGKVNATAYYPAGNDTWTADVMQNYGGAITWVAYGAPNYGDLNGDSKINSLDGLLLMRYLNGWTVNIASPEAMDVNGDGKVNSLDGLILMRYLNGWDVTLG